MADVELATAKYVQQAEQARAEAAAAQPAPTPAPRRPRTWEHAASYVSIVAAGAVLICVAAIAVPVLTSDAPKKQSNPIDLILRFGGAKSDQTFEKFLNDSIETSQREFEEKFRNSPAFEFDPEQLKLLTDPDFQGWQREPSPRSNSRR
jgi:hypothetical protein